MGTYVESAYVERLKEDIEIACGRLEEQGLEALVLTVDQDSHHVSGSQNGRVFLEQKYAFIAEFVQYCKDIRLAIKTETETVTLFNEQGKSVKIQQLSFPESIESLATPSLPENESTLNTPALDLLANDSVIDTPSQPDTDSTVNTLVALPNESYAGAVVDSVDYDKTQAFDTVALEDLVAMNYTEMKPGTEPPSCQRDENKKEVNGKNAEKESKQNEKKTELPVSRVLRSSKNSQSSNIVENLPRVKGVLTRLKKEKKSKEKKSVSEISEDTVALNNKTKKGQNKIGVIKEKQLPSLKSDNSEKALKTEMSPYGQKELFCSICKDTFDTVTKFQTHMAFHNALACHMCKKVFKSKEGLEEHKQQHIDSNEYNECSQCDKVFKFTWLLDEHVEKVHEASEEQAGNFPCCRCGHLFKQQLHLAEHNARNKDCMSEESRAQSKQNTDDRLLSSEIHFTDSESGQPKKRTVKEMLDNAKLPATCEVCQKTFDKLYNFKRHIVHHSEVKPYGCIICGQQFQLEENLKKHVKQHELRPYYCSNESCYKRFETKTRLDHHSRFTCKKVLKKPDLTCNECGHQSQSVQALQTHQRVHTGIKAFSCEICGKLLSTRESLERHKQVFHQEEKPYECAKCGKRFKIRDTLKKHEKIHGERKFKCEICGKLWIDSSELKKHKRTHSKIREKKFMCDFCGKAYERKSYMEGHRMIHTGETPFKCDKELCGKGCVEAGNLKKHMMTHTKEKPFICDTCGKTYGRRSLLDNHMRLHTGEKPYICEIEGCNKAFRSYGNLKQHKSTHTQGHAFICDICGKTFKLKSRMNHHRKFHTVDYRWPCDYCDQKFRSIFIYKNHLAKTHPLKKADIEERTNIRLYECNICQKMYGDKEDLTRHIYIHKGLKPFKCQYCGKAFNDKSNMKCHERIHTGEKKLSCGLCYKTFIQPRPLRQHMKNVHGKKFEIDEDIKFDDHDYMKEDNPDYTDQECQTAVETVLNADPEPPQLIMLPTSQAVITEPAQAVIAQTYPTSSLAQPGHLFPQLVKEFEPLMIVENY